MFYIENTQIWEEVHFFQIDYFGKQGLSHKYPYGQMFVEFPTVKSNAVLQFQGILANTLQ